jgi:hypothetical protein
MKESGILFPHPYKHNTVRGTTNVDIESITNIQKTKTVLRKYPIYQTVIS